MVETRPSSQTRTPVTQSPTTSRRLLGSPYTTTTNRSCYHVALSSTLSRTDASLKSSPGSLLTQMISSMKHLGSSICIARSPALRDLQRPLAWVTYTSTGGSPSVDVVRLEAGGHGEAEFPEGDKVRISPYNSGLAPCLGSFSRTPPSTEPQVARKLDTGTMLVLPCETQMPTITCCKHDYTCARVSWKTHAMYIRYGFSDCCGQPY